MKTTPVLLLTALATAASAQESTLDLTAPANYAQQVVPDYITKDNTPANNPITDLGATLGRVLFYDPRLSNNDSISCSSCHHQENAFGDLPQASTGVGGTTGRHSMRLINARFGDEDNFFWDERATSLEDQATKPIQDHLEMGFSGTLGDPGFADLVNKLSVIEEYQVLFSGVFGDPAVTEDRVQKSIAQFIRSIQSFDSKYDIGRAQVGNNAADFPNFSVAENVGKLIFRTAPAQGGAGCSSCHRDPEFDIDPQSGNNGVSGSLGGGTDLINTRAPSLRDLVDANGTPHGGFMHDASLADLMSVVNHYNAIPAVVTGLDRRLRTGAGGSQPQSLTMTQTEKDYLVAFLETLTGTSVYTDEKWSDPFDPDGSLPYVVLPSDGLTISLSGEENDRIATINAIGVPNVDYIVQSSTDMNTWTSDTVTATEFGEITADLPVYSTDASCFYRVIYEPGGGTITE